MSYHAYTHGAHSSSSIAIIMKIAYGHRAVSDDGPSIVIVKEADEIVTGIGDVSLIDFFPIPK